MSNIVELPKAQRSSITTVLRGIADSIECGEYGEITHASIVLEDNTREVQLFCAGADNSDYYRVITNLQKGLHWMLSRKDLNL